MAVASKEFKNSHQFNREFIPCLVEDKHNGRVILLTRFTPKSKENDDQYHAVIVKSGSDKEIGTDVAYTNVDAFSMYDGNITLTNR